MEVATVKSNCPAAIELGRIIAHFTTGREMTVWRSHQGIKSLCRFAKIANASELGRASGTSKLTAWYWWTGRARISLPMALHIYARLGASFSSALIGGAKCRPIEAEKDSQTSIHLNGRKPPRAIDWQRTAQQIAKILHRPIASAPTFLATARELGIERRTLRANLPKLCRSLAARYRLRARRNKAVRAAKLRGEFKKGIGTLAAAGLEPQQFRIEAVLRKPGLFNSRYARAVLAALISERG